MDKLYRRAIIIFVEFLVVYGLLGVDVSTKQILSEESFYLIIIISGLAFTFYYHMTGAILSILCSCLLIFLKTDGDLLGFFLLYPKEISLVIGILIALGLGKYSMEERLVSIEATTQLQAERIDHLRIQLSEKDKKMQDEFRDILTNMESPTILYHAIRRIGSLPDRQEYLNETLQVLYTYCHVEKSSIYERDDQGKLTRITTFGMSSLPDVLEWGQEEMPEILRVARSEKNVIIPKIIDNRLAMAIPLLSPSQEILYIILLEEIRFINFTKDLINLLKMSALWIKSLLEQKLQTETLLPFSVFSSVIVYKPVFAQEFLEEIATRYRALGVPYSLIQITLSEAITEQKSLELASALRLYDEIFMISSDQFVVLLTMTTPQDLPFIMKRLENSIVGIKLEIITSDSEIVYQPSTDLFYLISAQ